MPKPQKDKSGSGKRKRGGEDDGHSGRSSKRQQSGSRSGGGGGEQPMLRKALGAAAGAVAQTAGFASRAAGAARGGGSGGAARAGRGGRGGKGGGGGGRGGSTYRGGGRFASKKGGNDYSKASGRAGKPLPKDFHKAHGEIFNEEYIFNNCTIPQAKEYALSHEPIDSASKILTDAHVIMQKQAHMEAARYTEFRHRCSAFAELDTDVTVSATGHGRDKAEAERNCDLHLICQLHEKSLLKEILPGGRYASVAPSELLNENEAKRDIINFAARHDCLPVFKSQIGRSRIKKSLASASIEIPEMDLRGFGRAKTHKQAELQACVSLKRAAETQHERDGEGLLLVKDYTKLTLSSARQFLDYYGMTYKRGPRCEADTLKGGSGRQTDWQGVCTVELRSAQHEANEAAEQEDTPEPAAGSEQWETKQFHGIIMANKKDAEDTAYLVAALHVKKALPAFWKEFVREMKRGNGEILKPLRPIDIHIEYDVIETMRQTTREAQRLVRRDDSGDSAHEAEEIRARRDAVRRTLTAEQIARRNERMRTAQKQYEEDSSLAELREKRSQLPMVQHAEEVLKLVADNDVCVVGAATGSGKTTQLPQLLLEQWTRRGEGGACNIICTQPRRIAAISVAQRVAVERNEPLQQSVGYQVRFDAKLPQVGGSIAYCTTGILLRQLQDGSDEALAGITHILVDEVHERDIQIDFLLVLLKQIARKRRAAGTPAIKLVLMSATIDTTLFCKYFGEGFAEKRCPHIEVPGRAFPVTQHFLDDFHPELNQLYKGATARELHSRDSQAYVDRELRPVAATSVPPSHNVSETNSVVDDGADDKAVINWKSKGVVAEDGSLDVSNDKEDSQTPNGLMAVTIAHLLKTTTEGSILAFLPGLAEITAVQKLLQQGVLGVDMSAYKVYTLHSAVPQMQQEVFEKLDRRKVILSTNIAETSITIPDVVYVVDSGKHRENQFDQTKRISSLVSTWISKSNARQRAGRAGRVQHGHYYTLLSKARYDSLEIQSQPEMLRIDLQELCLQIKGMDIHDVASFLGQAIEPPQPSAIENAIDHLQALNALDGDEKLLPLGRVLSTFPVQPSLGKMALLGAIFRCLDPVLILAAASTARDPFLSPLQKRNEAEAIRKQWAKGTGSDLMAVLYAFQEWRRIRADGKDDRSFAIHNFLHYNTLVSIAQTAEQVLELMQKTGVIGGGGGGHGGSGNRRNFRKAALYGSAEDNIHAESLPLISALATAGFYPNIAVQTQQARLLRTAHENGAQIHPSSLAAPKTATGARYGPIRAADAYPYGTLLTYAQKTQADGQQVYLRGLTKTTPLSVVLFGGSNERDGAVLRIDGWIPFYARGPQMFATRDLVAVNDKFLADIFASIGTATRRHLLGDAADGAADDQREKLRDVLVNGIVGALEGAYKKLELQLPSSFKRHAYDNSPALSRASSRASSRSRDGADRADRHRGRRDERRPY